MLKLHSGRFPSSLRSGLLAAILILAPASAAQQVQPAKPPSKDPALQKIESSLGAMLNEWKRGRDGIVPMAEALKAVNDRAAVRKANVRSQGIEAWIDYYDGFPIDEAALFASGIRRDDHYRIVPGFVQAVVPWDRLEQVSILPGVRYVSLPPKPVPAVVSQGVSRTAASRYTSSGFTGQGVKIAVLDVGFSGYSSLLGSELPSNVIVKSFYGSTSGNGDITGGGDNHGTACAEIVYDMAPGATLYLVNINTFAEMFAAVQYLIGEGVDIVSHSLSWINTSFYDGDGPVSGLVSYAEQNGILWVNGAGNFGNKHWKGGWVDPDNDNLIEFYFANGDEGNSVSLTAGQSFEAYLTWNEWPSSTSDYDLYLYDPSQQLVASGTNSQSPGPPAESIHYTPPQSGTYRLFIKRNGSANTSVQFHLFASTGLQYQVAAGSVTDPAASPNALAVGAVFHSSNSIEPFSAQGPNSAGVLKPDLVAPDGVSTQTYGSSFFGTSAATPHVAGAAALIWSEDLTRAAGTVRSILESNATDLGTPAGDNVFGYGMVTLPVAIPPTAGNDSVSSPLIISNIPSASFVITTAATTEAADPSTPCGPSTSKTVWFRFTPTVSGMVIADTYNSSYDTILSLYEGSSGNFSLFTCNDDFGPGTNSKISFWAVAGTTYSFMVSAYYGDGGSLAFHLAYATPTVANDNQSNGKWISKTPFFDTQETGGASVEMTDPVVTCGRQFRTNSVWYRYSPTEIGLVTVDTMGSNYDTVLSVHSAFSNFHVCNDDSAGSAQSQIVFQAVRTLDYRIMIASFDDDGGSLALHLSPTHSGLRIWNADFDGDGKKDILWQHPDGNVAVWLMDGLNMRIGAGLLGPGTGWSVSLVGDFNGDGKSDIVWRHSDGRVTMWLMNGSDFIFGAGILGPGTGWRPQTTGDFNGDGKNDIVWTHSDGSTAMWLMNGINMLDAGGLLGPGSFWSVNAIADFDADGKDDILWRSDYLQYSIWLMDGFRMSIGGGLSVSTDWTVKTIGDFNGDGKSDIVWEHWNGTTSMWLMNGVNRLIGGGLLESGVGTPSWKVIDTGDFNGDGKNDIVWQDSFGRISIWLMDGLNMIGGAGELFSTDPSTAWTVKAIGDFNGDGKSDILWQHPDGNTAMWLMDGLNMSGGAGLLGANVGWRPVP